MKTNVSLSAEGEDVEQQKKQRVLNEHMDKIRDRY